MARTDTTTTQIAGVGIGGGVGAWLLGYLLVYVLHGSRIRNSFGTDVLEIFTGDPVTWKLAGWLFYNAHNVAVQVPGILGIGSGTVNFVARADEPGMTVLFFVPPVLLILAGVVTAWDTAEDPTTAARNGGAVALGYLPLSLAGVFLFAVGGDDSAGPILVTGVLLAGLVYPLIFGAVGGVVGGHLSSS